VKIVIPGGSGQIGSILARHFHQQGHTVTVLSRDPKAAPWQVIRWDAQTVGPWTAALEQSDICINLTGRSVNCRYHTENRRQMYDSHCFNPATQRRYGNAPTPAATVA
jgi:NAD dependent epimerase/dehydratase family enzyme